MLRNRLVALSPGCLDHPEGPRELAALKHVAGGAEWRPGGQAPRRDWED